MKTTEYDVVVVGGGGAGLAAAIEAATIGRRVVLLEKNPQLGGSTARSIGSVTATCTPHQVRKGIKDSPEAHFEDMAKFAGPLVSRDNLALRRLLTECMPDTLAWLMSLGLEFAGPSPEPPHRLPRMHNVLPNSRAFPYYLGRRCRKLGVDIRLNTHVEDLVNEGGRICGVRARTPENGEEIFRARGGVVLATGDYSASREMKAQYAAPRVVDADPVNPTSTGDGIRIGLAHGAVLVNADIVHGPRLRFVPPRRRKLIQLLPPNRLLARVMRWSFDYLPPVLLRPFILSFLTTALGPEPAFFRQGAILINKDGGLVPVDLKHPGAEVPKQRDREAYILFDDVVAQRFTAWPNFISTAPGVAYAYLQDYRRTRKDIFHTARTLDGLAKKLGIPAGALERTVAEHNARLGSDGGTVSPVKAAPFYALGPVKGHVVITEGGLRVNERLEVLKADGTPIKGLYAAGSTGQGGLLLEGHGHHLGWAFTSGRIAGRNAACAVTDIQG